MAEQLKLLFSDHLIHQLAKKVQQYHPPFPATTFISQVLSAEWPELALKQRMRHISQQLGDTLGLDYPQALPVILAVAPNFTGLTGMLFPDWVEVYGLHQPELSLPALAELTRYSSSEFAIRPFIQRYPELVLPLLQQWALSDDLHQRRLASEGARPRLPWGMALKSLQQDPSPLIPVLQVLNRDPEPYVQRSVANHLNDISKDHPALVLDLAQQWIGQDKTTDWILRHALRGLLKQANPQALSLFGLKPVELQLSLSLLNRQVSAQQPLQFQVSLDGQAAATTLRLEYRIGYRKKNGQISFKVFQWAKPQWQGTKSILTKQQRFIELTTRKHYTGLHLLKIRLTGQKRAEAELNLTQPSP